MNRLLLSLATLLLCLSAWGGPATIVIDAGHGGHDSGAPGKEIMEKEVNLKVALKLGEKLKKEFKDDVRVIYTRDKDFFVTLAERANIANKNNATMFVSIHSNSIGDTKRRNVVQGASVYVRGLASSKQAQEVAKRENAVLSMEDNRTIDTSSEQSVLNELVWNKNLEQSISLASNILDELVETAGRRRGHVEQNDLAVLKRTKMPAVLVELEYICNENMEKFMASKDGQEKFAKAIANGIARYCGLKKSNKKADKKQEAAETSAPKTEVKEKPQESNPLSKKSEGSGIDYRIQFLTSSTSINNGSQKLKGLPETEFYRDGNIYKYTTGRYQTLDEANKELKEVRKLFPDAFVIKMSDGKRVK